MKLLNTFKNYLLSIFGLMTPTTRIAIMRKYSLLAVMLLGVLLLTDFTSVAQTTTSNAAPLPNHKGQLHVQPTGADSSVVSTDSLVGPAVIPSRIGPDWPTQQPVLYTDPLYHYQLTMPPGWYISPTPADALYGAAVFYNFDPDAVEHAHELPQDALKVQIGVAPLPTGQDFQNWIEKWIDYEVNNEMNKDFNLRADYLQSAKIGIFNGVEYT